MSAVLEQTPAASASLDCRRARQRRRDHAGRRRAAVCARPARRGGSPCWRACLSCSGSSDRSAGCSISGIGIWGINSTIVWGVAIANYVWWIGIGNAGTLISAMLLLTRQPWRGSINRFAEAMTLFAVAIAGIMPIIHLGPADLCLLARPLSQHDGALAAVAQRAGLGFLGDRQLSAVFDPVLVRQPDSRSRHHARPHADARGTIALWRLRAGLARLGRALAQAADPAYHDGRARRSPGLLGAFDRRPRLRGEPDAGLAGKHLPALFRGRRDVFRLRHGGRARARLPLGPRSAGDHHPAAFRGDGARSC